MTCPVCTLNPLPDRLDWHLVSVHGWELSRATREYEALVAQTIKVLIPSSSGLEVKHNT